MISANSTTQLMNASQENSDNMYRSAMDTNRKMQDLKTAAEFALLVRTKEEMQVSETKFMYKLCDEARQISTS